MKLREKRDNRIRFQKSKTPLKKKMLNAYFKVIVYTSENNDTEEREPVIGSQKPGLYVISKKLDSAVEI